jgi:hypothetical protein
MRLYEYRWPVHDWRERLLVKTLETDQSGRFDFGVLAPGHYTLVIDWPSEAANSFDAEVKELSRRTSSVKIDASPVYPDCTGGHEFLMVSEQKLSSLLTECLLTGTPPTNP